MEAEHLSITDSPVLNLGGRSYEPGKWVLVINCRSPDSDDGMDNAGDKAVLVSGWFN